MKYKDSGISAFDRPVLVLHGDNDQMVDHSYGVNGAKAYPNATMITLPGEVHGWTGKGKVKAFQYSLDFISGHLA